MRHGRLKEISMYSSKLDQAVQVLRELVTQVSEDTSDRGKHFESAFREAESFLNEVDVNAVITKAGYHELKKSIEKELRNKIADDFDTLGWHPYSQVIREGT